MSGWRGIGIGEKSKFLLLQCIFSSIRHSLGKKKFGEQNQEFPTHHFQWQEITNLVLGESANDRELNGGGEI